MGAWARQPIGVHRAELGCALGQVRVAGTPSCSILPLECDLVAAGWLAQRAWRSCVLLRCGVVEYLPERFKALGSVPSTINKQII